MSQMMKTYWHYRREGLDHSQALKRCILDAAISPENVVWAAAELEKRIKKGG